MIIKKYGEFPRTYAPDGGEVLEARLSVSDPWVRAVVTDVRRARDGALRIKFVWLATQAGCTAVQGAVGRVYWHPVEGPPLIRQIDGGRVVQS